jgi:hypothetical protein
MKSKVGKIIISTSISLALIAGPIVLPLQASADNLPLNYDNPNKGGNNPYKISLQGVVTSGMLMNVVGCTGIVNKISKVSTSFIQNLIQSKTEKAARIAQKTAYDTLKKITEGIAKGVASGAMATPGFPVVMDSGIRVQNLQEFIAETARAEAMSKTAKLDMEALNTASQRIKDETAAASFREECINGIAVTLAKNQLSAMTKYTMNWVNSGFNGDPLFVRNVDSLMYSIENKILEEQTRWFKDPVNAREYPYGRDFAISAINSKQSGDNFLDSMKSDLTAYLTPGATTDSFANDFSEGGWNGWFALTQRSQNNPLGFMIEQSEYLSQEQTTATENTKDELARNGGVLDQRKCVQYYPYDPIRDRDNQVNANGNRLRCAKYEAVTPGSVIKTKIDTYVNSAERQLELARTMNDALNALFSALIYKFQNQGLSSLSSSVNNYSGTATAGFGVNQVLDSNGNSILVANGGGTGTSNGGDGYIDLTKDLGNTYVNGQITKKGILQIEHDYIKAAKESVIVLDKVVPAIGKLDYCIPGPNPSWKANSLDAIDAYLSTLDGGGTPAIDPSAIENQIASYETEVGTLYGPSSPMQTFASGSYLGMADQGLAITKDLAITAETVKDAKDEYRDAITEANTNMTKLNVIKDKVNVIIAAAQRRRTTERATLGLTAMPASCLANEKATYLDNGVRR